MLINALENGIRTRAKVAESALFQFEMTLIEQIMTATEPFIFSSSPCVNRS